MKKIMLSAITCLLLTTGMDAQRKELAITFSGLNSFGFSYRAGNDAALWRFNTVLGLANSSKRTYDSLENSSSSTQIRLAAGREWRKPINEKLTFRYGLDLRGSFRKNYSEYKDMRNVPFPNNRLSEDIVYGAGTNIVLGFNYQFSPNFLAGLEFLPSYTYYFGNGRNSSNNQVVASYDIQEWNTDINLNAILLSLVYVFD